MRKDRESVAAPHGREPISSLSRCEPLSRCDKDGSSETDSRAIDKEIGLSVAGIGPIHETGLSEEGQQRRGGEQQQQRSSSRGEEEERGAAEERSRAAAAEEQQQRRAEAPQNAADHGKVQQITACRCKMQHVDAGCNKMQ